MISYPQKASAAFLRGCPNVTSDSGAKPRNCLTKMNPLLFLPVWLYPLREWNSKIYGILKAWDSSLVNDREGGEIRICSVVEFFDTPLLHVMTSTISDKTERKNKSQKWADFSILVGFSYMHTTYLDLPNNRASGRVGQFVTTNCLSYRSTEVTASQNQCRWCNTLLLMLPSNTWEKDNIEQVLFAHYAGREKENKWENRSTRI